ncbi:MAG: hypothetical protein WAV72_14115 [Bradyrhizobium sp.]
MFALMAWQTSGYTIDISGGTGTFFAMGNYRVGLALTIASGTVSNSVIQDARLC